MSNEKFFKTKFHFVRAVSIRMNSFVYLFVSRCNCFAKPHQPTVTTFPLSFTATKNPTEEKALSKSLRFRRTQKYETKTSSSRERNHTHGEKKHRQLAKWQSHDFCASLFSLENIFNLHICLFSANASESRRDKNRSMNSGILWIMFGRVVWMRWYSQLYYRQFMNKIQKKTFGTCHFVLFRLLKYFFIV